MGGLRGRRRRKEMMQVQYTYMKCKNILKMQWQPSRHLKDAFARVLALLSLRHVYFTY